MKRVALFLSEPQLAAFRALAHEVDRPYAELIREALDDYLRRRRERDGTRKTERKRGATRRRS